MYDSGSGADGASLVRTLIGHGVHSIDLNKGFCFILHTRHSLLFRFVNQYTYSSVPFDICLREKIEETASLSVKAIIPRRLGCHEYVWRYLHVSCSRGFTCPRWLNLRGFGDI